MKKIVVCIILIAGLAISGCTQRKVAQPVQPATQQVQQQPQQQTTVKSGEPEATRKGVLGPEERITEQELAKIETKDEIPQYKEESGLFKDIHFDYDQYEVKPDDKGVLQNITSWLLKNTSAKLAVEGHCDDRGTNEYNLALGDRRAKAVRDYLVALGVPSNRIEMTSYGEEKPLCPEKTEDCWAKNRRAHFVVLREAGK